MSPQTSGLRLQAARARARGFSLLEVMVAIAILGLVLTVILSAQGGLAASNRSAANMGQAVSLGRCKMSEIEEKMLKMGYPEIDAVDPGMPCCEDEKSDLFRCDTRIEKIVMPNFTSGNSLGDGGSLIGPGSSAGTAGIPGLVNPAGSGGGLSLDVDAGLGGLGSALTSQMGAGGAGAQGMLSMVMGIVYPGIKPMFEASIRRLTVTVKWKEGMNERELPLVQYVTNPQRGGFAGSALLPDGGMMDFGAPGTAPTGTGAPGAPTTPGLAPTSPGGGGTR
jgi:general secretion pathway protein I